MTANGHSGRRARPACALPFSQRRDADGTSSANGGTPMAPPLFQNSQFSCGADGDQAAAVKRANIGNGSIAAICGGDGAVFINDDDMACRRAENAVHAVCADDMDR